MTPSRLRNETTLASDAIAQLVRHAIQINSLSQLPNDPIQTGLADI